MNDILLIFTELAAGICLFYSCRCYVKHIHMALQTSRRNISYILFVVATALSLLALKEAPLALICNGVLIFYFSFYICFKVRKHVRMLPKYDSLSEKQHSVVAKNYRNWYCVFLFTQLAVTALAIILH